MEPWLVVLIGLALTFAIIVLLGRWVTRRAASRVDPTQLTLDASVMPQVQALAIAGQKIDAIVLLRKSNPTLSLTAAKVIVERMTAPRPGTATVAGVSPAASAIPGVDAAAPAAAFDDPTPSGDGLAVDVALQARELKLQGQSVQAVKLVRDSTGWGLREAKRFVDGLS